MRFSDRLTRANPYLALDITRKNSKQNAISAASAGAFLAAGRG
jgi:hypothetical protein